VCHFSCDILTPANVVLIPPGCSVLQLTGGKSLNDNSIEIKNSAVICNTFNTYLCSMGQKLVEREVTNGYHLYMSEPMVNSMCCDSLSNDEILELIAKIDEKKTIDPDNILFKIVKDATLIVIKPLKFI
jgi:hypothetical protein